MGIRRALLVGTAQYRDQTLSRLRAPAQDAHRLADLLRDPALGRFDTVRVLVDGRKHEIDEEIEDLFADRTSDDLVLLYLACHGVKNERGRLFFAAGTTDLARLHATAVSAATVNDIMEQSRAGMKVAMLDCCFSGAYARGFAPRSAAGEQLAQQLAGRGTFVMTATDALEYAYEDGKAVPAGEEQSSIFTRSVIEGLQTGAADLKEDGVVTAEELFEYVEQRVAETGRQTPKQFCVNVSGMIPIAWVPPRAPTLAAARTRPGEGACSLGGLLPALTETADRGLSAADWPGTGRLTVPLGLARAPGQRDRATFSVDLSSWAGNIGVAGVSQSGKTTLLRTLVCALALTHTPREVQAYCLDFDGDLSPLAGLPHVGGVAGQLDATLAGEIVTLVTAVADRRRARFPRLGIDSMRTFRARKSRGELTDDPFGDVFLLIDGWPAFARHFPNRADQVLQLAEYGLRFGVHLAVSAPRWADLPEPLRQRLPARIELPLADPRESEFDPALAAVLPAGSPGCGLVRGPATLNVCLPRIDGSRSAEDLGDGLADLVARVDPAWQGPAAPPALTEAALAAGAPPEQGLPELLGITDLRKLPLDRLWATRGPADLLRVPIGVAMNGEPVLLDLKERALDGMGPHGLVVGATGSGKSELIRALVLSLALTHPPGALNLLLADAKGGATFITGLHDLPHVAGLATNLLDEPAAVGRLADAIQGELTRRQELLRAAGNYSSARDYQRARQTGSDLPEMPRLVLVIDEFSELLTIWPSFLDMLVTVGRVGRSLGVHMVLASQRLEEGRLRGLDSLLSFRIGLRMSSAAESRAVLGVPDAYELPPIPGAAYLRSDPGELARFRVAWVSGFADPGAVGEYAPTVLDVAVDRFRDYGPRAQPILLPPLRRPPTLDQLWAALPGPDGQDGQRRLLAPAGITDRPLEHSQRPLVLDLTGVGGTGRPPGAGGDYAPSEPSAAYGNAVIVGAAGSGKSTLAAALICSLAMRHAPEDVQFFLVWPDGAGEFQSLAGLPHTCAAAGRRVADSGLEDRIVTVCSRLIDLRERAFAETGIGSFAEYRARQARGEFGDDPYGDVFVVADGWLAIRQQSEDLEQGIARLAQRGPGYGIHVIVTAQRWFDIRPSLRDALGTRLELRLSEPYESEVNRRAAAALPAAPGHGLTSHGTHFLAALPRDDGVPETAGLRGAVAALANRCADRWQGRAAPRLRTLPRLVPFASLAVPAGEHPLRIPVGLDEELRPVFADLGAAPHLLVFGDPGSGKTAFLRGLARSLASRCTPDQVQIVIADYRRSLLDAVSSDKLIGYGASAPALGPLITDAADAIRARIPGPDVTTDQLRSRSWWRGPELVVLVDDYDLIAAGTANPLQPLIELLPQASDLGLHLVLARRAAGAARALYDQVIQRLMELGTPGILLSADRDEGMLLGIRPTTQPPGRGTLVSRRGSPVTIQLAYDGAAEGRGDT